MYLGTIYFSTEFRPDRTSNMAAAILENKQSAVTPELIWLDHLQLFIICISNKYTGHDTRVFDLTYFFLV
jgi:hypothetical protein